MSLDSCRKYKSVGGRQVGRSMGRVTKKGNAEGFQELGQKGSRTEDFWSGQSAEISSPLFGVVNVQEHVVVEV